jgi:flagellar hook-length control protein FliK
VPLPSADVTALLAGQNDATATLAPTALPVDFNAPENLPAAPTPTTPVTATAGDIAILSMASPPAGQAANAAALAPRPTDNRAAPAATQTPNGLSTRTSGTGRLQSDDNVKSDASSSMSTPSDSTTLPTDPMVVPLAPISIDSASPDDDTASQPDNSSVSAVGTNAVSTGAAAAQQAQTLYTKTASRTDALPQVTVDQVAMHLTKAADDGIDHLTIHLKPAELGSIEVKLEMGDDGISKATITADRQDTLNLMQRDSHRLEQALDNAGLKTDPGSLSFNLRGDGGRNNPSFAQGNGSPYAPFTRSTTDDAAMPVNPALLGYINSRAALGGVDIRV